jgi:RNA polymerase sigma-70 factor (ECF subfamily)
MIESDSELIERVLAGDQRAARRLLVRHRGDVQRLFARRKLAPTTIDELTQETMIAGFCRLATLAQRDRFRAWILEIARHKLIDHFRANRRLRARFVSSPGACESACEHSFAALARLEAGERRQRLIGALARLPGHSQELMQRYYVQECSRRQLAEQLGIPVGTVGSRLALARKQLAAQLGERERWQ